MTKEELFKKNFPEYVTEKGACLSPFWDLFSAGIECATYELNKGCIQTLTKENAELKAGYDKAMKEWRDCFMSCSSPYCADKFRNIQCSGMLGNMTKEEKRNEGMA